MKETIVTMSSIEEGEVNGVSIIEILANLDQVIEPFEINESGSVESLGYADYWETTREFIEDSLSLINKYSVVKADDGLFSVVNGVPLTFVSNEKLSSESPVVDLIKEASGFQDEAYEYTSDKGNINTLSAPTGFKAGPYFKSGDLDELKKILFFDGRTLPEYMDDISRIESSDMVGSPDGYISGNNNQLSFELFGETWELDKEVYRLEYDEANEQLFDVSFTARDFIEQKVDLQFFNLKKVEHTYVDSLNENLNKEENSYGLGR